jgi:predicted phosphodiesterase
VKIVVVSNIHEAENVVTDVEAAIAREGSDLTVFLGDVFDRWHDGLVDVERTAL